jgi:hypothetical protein
MLAITFGSFLLRPNMRSTAAIRALEVCLHASSRLPRSARTASARFSLRVRARARAHTCMRAVRARTRFVPLPLPHWRPSLSPNHSPDAFHYQYIFRALASFPHVGVSHSHVPTRVLGTASHEPTPLIFPAADAMGGRAWLSACLRLRRCARAPWRQAQRRSCACSVQRVRTCCRMHAWLSPPGVSELTQPGHALQSEAYNQLQAQGPSEC